MNIYDGSGALMRSFKAPLSDHPISSPAADATAFDPFKKALTVIDGNWSMSYDGTDPLGTVLPNGIYLMEIRSSQGSQTTVATLMFTILGKPVPIASAIIAPNPVLKGQPAIWIRWLPFEPAEIRVYNAAGDLIRTFAPTSLPPLLWDLKTASGENAASGVYIVAIRVPGERQSRVFKLAVAR